MAAIVLNLPALHPLQREIRNTVSRFKIIRCGRRFGKTTLAAVACVEVALGIAPWHHRCNRNSGQPNPGRAWWVPPTYKQALIGWRVLTGLCRALQRAGVQVEIKKSDWTIEFPGGGEITLRSADSSSGLRGDGLDFLVMEEAAYSSPENWYEDLRPALSDRRGEAWFITTPKGYNWFYELEAKADGRDRWAVFHAPTQANPHIDDNEIAELAADMSPVDYQQEILAEYVDDASNPFQRAWLRYHRQSTVVDGDNKFYVWSSDQPNDPWNVHQPDTVRFATVDLAVSLKESADYTAICSVAVKDGRLIVLDVIRERIASPDLIPTLRTVIDRWDLRYVAIEKVGYQLAAIQNARRAGLPVRELIADRDKLARTVPLQVKMEAGQVSFPRMAPWLTTVEAELLAFPAAEHDDVVDALAYAALEAGRIPNYAVA